MEGFSFSKDFKKINWGTTLTYNFMRGASAGLIIGLIIAMNSPRSSDLDVALVEILLTVGLTMIMLPVGIMIFFLPFNFILGWFNGINGGIYLFMLRIVSHVFSIIPGLGDPIIKVLYSFYPNIFGIQKPKWFNAVVIVFILKS